MERGRERSTSRERETQRRRRREEEWQTESHFIRSVTPSPYAKAAVAHTHSLSNSLSLSVSYSYPKSDPQGRAPVGFRKEVGVTFRYTRFPNRDPWKMCSVPGVPFPLSSSSSPSPSPSSYSYRSHKQLRTKYDADIECKQRASKVSSHAPLSRTSTGRNDTPFDIAYATSSLSFSSKRNGETRFDPQLKSRSSGRDSFRDEPLQSSDSVQRKENPSKTSSNREIYDSHLDFRIAPRHSHPYEVSVSSRSNGHEMERIERKYFSEECKRRVGRREGKESEDYYHKRKRWENQCEGTERRGAETEEWKIGSGSRNARNLRSDRDHRREDSSFWRHSRDTNEYYNRSIREYSTSRERMGREGRDEHFPTSSFVTPPSLSRNLSHSLSLAHSRKERERRIPFSPPLKRQKIFADEIDERDVKREREREGEREGVVWRGRDSRETERREEEGRRRERREDAERRENREYEVKDSHDNNEKYMRKGLNRSAYPPLNNSSSTSSSSSSFFSSFSSSYSAGDYTSDALDFLKDTIRFEDKAKILPPSNSSSSFSYFSFFSPSSSSQSVAISTSRHPPPSSHVRTKPSHESKPIPKGIPRKDPLSLRETKGKLRAAQWAGVVTPPATSLSQTPNPMNATSFWNVRRSRPIIRNPKPIPTSIKSIEMRDDQEGHLIPIQGGMLTQQCKRHSYFTLRIF